MRAADYAWTAIAVGATTYEIVAALRPDWQLLSEAMDGYRVARPFLVTAGIVYFAGHLLRAWPPEVDPLTRISRLVHRRCASR